jgi:metal-responsive CopG/Arc/MetJ family transcriptional regulator
MGKIVKVLVSIDDRLLVRVDKAAREAGLSRSAFLARAAAREVEPKYGPGRDPRVHQAMAGLRKLVEAHGGFGDATAIIREMRDSRWSR